MAIGERLSSEKEVRQFVSDAQQAFAPTKQELLLQDARDLCFYEGIQWLTSNVTSPVFGRLRSQYNPDSSELRVTVNRIAKFCRETAAATYPSRIEIEAHAPPASLTSESMFRAQVIEDMANWLAGEIGYRAARVDANFRRVITGHWCVGLSLAKDGTMDAFDFPAWHLTLDPHVTCRDLRKHDYVIYSDVWTAEKIERELGMKLDREQLQTVGQLLPEMMTVNQVSENRLFARYRAHSRTKGAIVRQVHLKTNDGRFGKMHVLVEKPEREIEPVVTGADSPFGGHGLPIVMLHGHQRGDDMWSYGDVRALRDDQNKLNLLYTMIFRHLRSSALYKVLVDTRSLPDGKQREDLRNMYGNRIGEVIPWKSGSRDQPGSPPAVMQYPQPPPILTELSVKSERDMMEGAHRADLHAGRTKSHVPHATSELAAELADQVLGIRVLEDIEQDQVFMTMAVGTAVKSARNMSQRVLRGLKLDAGFGREEFEIVAGTDPVRLGATLRIRESSIRFRSQAARRQDLLDASESGGLDAQTLRREFATVLDTPISEDDRYYSREASKAAMKIMAGGDWEPLPLGEHTHFFISEFRKALLKADESTRQKLVFAIQSLRQMQVQDAIESDPALAAQIQTGGAGVQTPQVQENPDVSQLIEAIESRGGSAPSVAV